MRVISSRGPRLPKRTGPPSRRFEIRPNGELRKPKSRRAKERRYPWVMMDHHHHRVVAYFASKRLAERELARRTA